MEEVVNLKRRELLRTSTGLLTGLVLAGSPLAAIARGPRWAVDLTVFTSLEGASLMAVSRTICPHDELDDAAYALVVEAIDSDASKEENRRQMIRDGIASLAPNFAASAENDRVEALKKIESSAFFQAVRLKTVQVLYATPMAYAYFGYEGEAFSKGGYLLRGFNNLRWVPEVPLQDSGPMPVSA